MRRFTDPILFASLFLLDVIAYLVLLALNNLKSSVDPGHIAPMTIGAVIVIAIPALFLATFFAFVRSLRRISPTQFYALLLSAAALSALVTTISNAMVSAQDIEVGFGWMAWFFSVQALAYVIALILALTGGLSEETVPYRDTENDKNMELKNAEETEVTLPEEFSVSTDSDMSAPIFFGETPVVPDQKGSHTQTDITPKDISR